jgi:pimeloyl-ACP methyl ester carboxylesterase
MHDPTVETFLPGLPARTHATRDGIAWLEHGVGPLMILCHGGAGSWSHWVRNIPVLGRHFTVAALDLPGFGVSVRVDRDTAPDDYLRLVNAVVDEILAATGADNGPGTIHIAGFSFGALMATSVAAHLGQRADALTLIGAAGFRKPEGRNISLMSIRALGEKLGREPTWREVRDLHKSNLNQLMIWDADKIDDRVLAMQDTNVARARFNSRPYSWSNRAPGFLAEAQCRLQVIYGRFDGSAHPDIDYRIAQCRLLHPDAEVTVLPDCGHWAMYEAADKVNELMLEFHLTR